MDFAAEPTPNFALGIAFAGLPLIRAAGCAQMGTHRCIVRHHRSHVWVLSELPEYVGPDTALFLACLALEDAVSLAIAVCQFTPLGSGSQYPVNCFNETATLLLLPCIGSTASLQICGKFLPLMVGYLSCRHPTFVANVTEQNKCQRNLESPFFISYHARDVYAFNIIF